MPAPPAGPDLGAWPIIPNPGRGSRLPAPADHWGSRVAPPSPPEPPPRLPLAPRIVARLEHDVAAPPLPAASRAQRGVRPLTRAPRLHRGHRPLPGPASRYHGGGPVACGKTPRDRRCIRNPPLVSALRRSIFHLIHLYEISIISNTRRLNTYYFMIDNKCITQHDLPSCPILIPQQLSQALSTFAHPLLPNIPERLQAHR